MKKNNEKTLKCVAGCAGFIVGFAIGIYIVHAARNILLN